VEKDTGGKPGLAFINCFFLVYPGIWYGFGYCPCTDWHFQVRMKLGDFDLPYSYIKFCIDSLTGLDVNAELVNILTLTLFLLALMASIFVNIKDWRKKGHRLTQDKHRPL
jgi:hypothetical protein